MNTSTNNPTNNSATGPAFRLLPSLQFTPHISGGRRWYAVEDPQSGRFLKLGTAEYLVASGLQNGVAPAQIIEVLEVNGFDQAKDRVTSTISWLAKQGLLLTESGSRSTEPATGEGAKAARPSKPLPASSLTIDPFFIRLPLLPGQLAERLAKPWMWLVSWPCALLLMGVLAAALLTVVNGSARFWSLNEKLFVEDGRLWWLAAWFVLKCVHEMGHAIAGVSTGSRIRSAGLHFIFLAPVPYVDVTDLWRVTNGRQRMLVSAAGMLAEIAVASVAVLVAFHTTNLQLQYFCAAVATLGTITTIAFNGNPLMKFDGYYILSDYLSRPNLWTEAQTAASGLVKRVLNPFTERLGWGLNAGGWSSHGLQAGLTAFGLTTMFYRFVMLGTMAWWLITVWNGIGALIIAWAVWGWFVRPIWLKRASTKAAIAAGLVPPGAGAVTAGRQRAQWAYTAGLIAGCVLIAFLPCPGGISAPGIVGYGNPTTVRTAAEGVLEKVLVVDRQEIHQGDLIARLDNPQLLVELADTRLKYQASLEQANALRARGELAMLQAEQAKMESLASHTLQLEDRAAQLEIRASCSGMLLMNLAEKIEGRFVKPGSPVCMIVSPQSLEVVASASQRDATFFSQQVHESVWVAATGGLGKPGNLVSVDSRGSKQCDQQALAARYGGPLPVEFSTSEAGEQKLQYSAPRFAIKADLNFDSQHSNWIPGQMVWLSLSDRHERIWQWIARSFE